FFPVRNETGVGRTGDDGAPQVGAERRVLRNIGVQAIERKRRDAFEMEAAGGQRQAKQHAHGCPRAHQYAASQRKKLECQALHGKSHPTILTSLPGTTITRFGGRFSRKRAVASCASAMDSISGLGASLGTKIEPRSLPLICSINSISSAIRA